MRGKAVLFAEGDTERLLELCAEKGVFLHKIRRINDFAISFTCFCEDLPKIAACRKRSACKISVLKKKGFAFTLAKIAKRPVLVGGFFLAVALLWLLGCFIWSVEIRGCIKTDEKALRALLDSEGVKIGAFYKALDTTEIKNNIICAQDNIAYLTLNIEGTNAVVTVYERTEVPEIRGKTPCDVVSDITGIVESVTVRQGEACVNRGKSIFAGDLIAKGEITGKDGEKRYVHADAEAQVRTGYTLKSRVASEGEKLVPTGREQKKYYFLIFNKIFPLNMIETSEYKCYSKKVERSYLTLGEKIRLPFGIMTETISEQKAAPVQIKADEQMLKDRLLSLFIRAKPKAEITASSFYITEKNGGYECVLRTECREKTGIKTEMK